MSLKNIRAKAAQQLSQKEVGKAQKNLDAARSAAGEGKAHFDGWVNSLTGIGTALGDKRQSAYFQRDALSWDQAEDLWRSDDAAARLIECLPDEMVREGFELVVQNEKEGIGNAKENIGEDDEPTKGAPGKPAKVKRTDAGAEQAGGNFKAESQSPTSTPQPMSAAPLAEDDDAKDIAEMMMARCEDLDVQEKFRTALYYANAFGGGAILIGTNDGQADWSKPLNEDNIKSIDFLNVLEPRELLPLSYYGDPRAPKYGEPAVYQLNRSMVGGESNTVMAYLQVHETRLIRFDGIRTSRRMLVANAGWGDSIFVRVAKIVRAFQSVYDGAELLLADFSQAVLKIKDLAEYVSKNGKDVVTARAQALSLGRSIANTVLVDAEEDFQRVATPMQGFPEMLDRFCNRLAMAAKMPVTILMGQAPAGLNATGAADLEWFANQVRAEQVRRMKKQLLRLIKLMFLEKSGITSGVEPENWSVKFKPLKQLSQKEEAEIHFQQAQADNLYVTNEVLLPAEVAKSRFGGDDYSLETTVDLDLRDQTRAAVMKGEEIDDPFHTGAGEPGATNAQAPELSQEVKNAGALAQIAGAGANKGGKPSGHL